MNQFGLQDVGSARGKAGNAIGQIVPPHAQEALVEPFLPHPVRHFIEAFEPDGEGSGIVLPEAVGVGQFQAGGAKTA